METRSQAVFWHAGNNPAWKQLVGKPQKIYKMDENVIQVNNVPENVVAEKEPKDVHVLTSSEKGERVTVIACCSVEGTLLPLAIIMKAVR